MARRSRGWILWLGAAVVLGGAIAYESMRARPPMLEPVRSRPSQNADEAARLEGNLKSTTSRNGKRLFDMIYQSLVVMQDGTNLLRNIDKFTIYTEDGRPVVVQAARGKIEEARNGQNVKASLEGNVVVRSPDGLVLETELLVYDTTRRRLTSPGTARISGEGLAAGMSGFDYSPDSRTVDAKGPLQVELGQGAMWRVDSGQAQYRQNSGELQFTTPFRARQPGRTLIGGPALLVAPGAPATARIDAAGPVLIHGRTADLEWQIAAGDLKGDGLLPRGGAAIARTVHLGSPTSMIVLKGRGGEAGSGSVHAERWDLDASPNGTLERALGGPGFDVHWTGAAGEGSWSLAGDWLELHESQANEIDRAQARGNVTFNASQGANAEGALLEWDAHVPSEIRLFGEPGASAGHTGHKLARAHSGTDVVEAPRITILRDQRILVADDNPLTEAGSLRQTDGPLFNGKEPVRVKSARVTIPDGTGPIDFEGPVQAWQEDSTLRCGKLRLVRAESRLFADGDVQLLMPVGDPAKGNRRRVRLLTQHLDFDNAKRVAVLTGRSVYEEPGTRVEADRIDAKLRKEGGVEDLTAVGNVILRTQGNTGTSDRLLWTGGGEGSITLIGETSQATLETQQQGNVKQRAARLRYDLKDRRGYASGGGGRTVLEGVGTPPPPKPAGDGSKEERR